MTDEKNGEQIDAGQNPPPLVPPPVRRNDSAEQVSVDHEQAQPIGSDEPVFREPTTDRDDDGPNGTKAYEPAATDDATGGPVGRDLIEDRPGDPAYDEPRLDPAPQSLAASPIPTVDPPILDSDSDDDDDRDLDGADQPYRPVSARATADEQDHPPVAARAADSQDYPPAAATSFDEQDHARTDARNSAEQRYAPRTADDASARDVAAAHQDVRDTSRNAETVAVGNPSTSPSAPPQPVFVPAADGGTERTTGFPPATGQQREFVQPPVAPKKKGNRGIGSLIALLSVILFAVAYALVAAAVIAVQVPQSFSGVFTTFLANPLFWVPAIIFVVAFVIVVLLANRAAWWAYVLGSLLVGALVYFGTIGVALLIDNVFAMTSGEALDRFLVYVPNPFIIAAGLVAREVSLWTGSAIAARGRRIKERNVTSKDEYERASADHRADYERAYSPAG